MTEEKSLEYLYNELMDKYIETPEELEKQITEVAAETASSLRFRPDGAWMKFQGPEDEEPRLFKVQYRKKIDGFKVFILIVIADIRKYEDARARNVQYSPFAMQIESNTTFDEITQLRASLEAFLRHISGAVAPEEIEEE